MLNAYDSEIVDSDESEDIQEETVTLDMGQISRILMSNGDIDNAEDLDAYMAEKLTLAVNNGTISPQVAKQYAEKQQFVENGYMKSYDNIGFKDNLIKKKEDITYKVAVISKNSKVKVEGKINAQLVDGDNRVTIQEMYDVPTAKSYANKTRGVINSFEEAKEYCAELFKRILQGIKYRLEGKTVNTIEVLGTTLRVDKIPVNLEGITTEDRTDNKLTLAELFDVNQVMAQFSELRHLTVDIEVMELMVLRSESNNPIDDIFKNSGIQTISVFTPTKALKFQCTDTDISVKETWLKLRDTIIQKQKLHSTTGMMFIDRWEPQYFKTALIAEKYANESEWAQTFFRTLSAEQGNAVDKLKNRLGKFVKQQRDKLEAGKTLRQNKKTKKVDEDETDAEVSEQAEEVIDNDKH